MKNSIAIPVTKERTWSHSPASYIHAFLVSNDVIVDDGPCHVSVDDKSGTFIVGIPKKSGSFEMRKKIASGRYFDVDKNGSKDPILVTFDSKNWASKMEDGCKLDGSDKFVDELSKIVRVAIKDKKAVRKLFEKFSIPAATDLDANFCHGWCREDVANNYGDYCSR